jgi:hypothetical protein
MILSEEELKVTLDCHFTRIVASFNFDIQIIDRWEVIFFRPTFAIAVVGDHESFQDFYIEKTKVGHDMTGLFRERSRRVGLKMEGMTFGPAGDQFNHEKGLARMAYVWENYLQDILSGEREWLARYPGVSKPYANLLPWLDRLQVVDESRKSVRT